MSKKKRGLSPDEAELWDRVAATVKPKARQKAAGKAEAQIVEPPRPRTLPPAPACRVAPTPASPPAQPQDRSAEKRVRRGNLEIGATLDLHGHTQASAHAALARFLLSASARGDRALIVVTGVGRAGQGILKQRLPEWLAEPNLAAVVSGYAPAHRSHGGAGAFYVFLRRRRTGE